MREHSNIFLAWRKSNGLGPAQLQMDKVEPTQAAPGNHCVHASGHIENDGKERILDDLMCALDVNGYGVYSVSLNFVTVPNELAEKDQPTVRAISASLQMNGAVIEQQNQAMLQQKQENDRMVMQQAQRAIDNIHAIGAQATARYNATQQANDAQHAAWWAQQDNNARNNQAYTNNFRDQTVVRDTYFPNEHATVYNTTFDWLQHAFPDRIEEVPKSQFIKGQDY